MIFSKSSKRLLAVLLLLILSTQTVWAQANMGVMPTTRPANQEAKVWFIYENAPGDIIEDTVVISNSAAFAQTVELSAVDATQASGGGFALETVDREKDTIGKWVKFEEKVITIEPGEKVEYPFILEIPEDTPPGDYAGGIIIGPHESPEEETNANASGIVAVINVGVRIYISVTGAEVIDFNWTNYSDTTNESGQHLLSYTFDNLGNVNMEANAKITVKNLFSKPQIVEKDFGTILPGEITSPYQKLWEIAPPIGLIKATTELNYKRKRMFGSNEDEYTTIEDTITFFIIPMREVIISLIIFLIIFLVLFIKHLKFKKTLTKCTKYKAIKNESITDIATKKVVDWKLLAKINNLKPPYVIEKDTIILIPPKKD
ncbi:DUF916 domain-containing protein [Patescibacteria group bacterium]|nr:DUF916 domain-containing protein [Patescibacteria group bacterium]